MCSSQLGTSVIPIVLLCNTNSEYRDIIQRHTARFFLTHTNGMRIEAAESRMVNGGYV